MTWASRLEGSANTASRHKLLVAVTALVADQAVTALGSRASGGAIGRTKGAAANLRGRLTKAIHGAKRIITALTRTLGAVAVQTAATLCQGAASNGAAVVPVDGRPSKGLVDGAVCGTLLAYRITRGKNCASLKVANLNAVSAATATTSALSASAASRALL